MTKQEQALLKLDEGKDMDVQRNKLILFSLLFSFFLFLPNTTYAQLFGGPSHVKMKLVSEVRTVQPGQPFWIIVQLNMDEHWHVYWRNVGDTGLITSIEWDLPQGVTAGPIQWPYPEKIVEDPLVVFGYHGEQYLLVKITPDNSLKPGTTLQLKAHGSWLVCAESCVPGEDSAALELPVTKAPAQVNTDAAELFSTARARLPLKNTDWKFSLQKESNRLIIQAQAPEWFKSKLSNLEFYPYAGGYVKYSSPQTMQHDGSVYTLEIPLAAEPAVPDTIRGILMSESGWRGNATEKALEISLVPGSSLPTSRASGDGLNSIWLAILFSFLGGIILNLMPCVLPVLSIKIMSFVKQAHDEQMAPWKHGLSFTVGVLISFVGLAALLLILKAGGASLGWGFQLQSPTFIIIVSVFMFLFGLSMLGVYEIGTSMTTIGGKTQDIGGLGGSFFSGIIATIVATPCTAPFMGTALGFALTQPAWVSLTVFFFLGLGMAAPFFLLSSIPALLKYVPKPGRWMESLEQFMGFLLVGTVLWLLWVLAIQAGSNAVILVLADLFLSAVGTWIYGRWGNLAMPKKTRRIAWVLAFLFVAGSNGYVLANIDSFAVSQETTLNQGEGIEWQKFSEEKVAELQAQGKPVFIDFTAAWCLSCQVNEQVAFSDTEVQKQFKELGITALKADWTKRDATIAKALAKFNRNSVPLYVLYGKTPGAAPQLLPEIITPGIVLDALQSIK